MRQLASLMLLALAMLAAPPLSARDVVEATAPEKVAVTVYRDPNRGEGDAMRTNFPRGFAMISETRTVTLPAGPSTIQFTGVAEGMVAVTAIVTGLPGGIIEKNRNADLLSPGALVDGTLGNRVRINRTNPGTGKVESEDAIIRTRADGGIVLQTAGGYEAVRCSGLPEGLSFNRVPGGLSAQPIFTLDTNSPQGGTHTVTLTYLAWGFDWQAHYVARLDQQASNGKVKMSLLSWLTLLNDNGQSFADAELMAVAGRLSVVSNFQGLAEPPKGKPLRLNCFPIGSTATGSPIPGYPRSELGGEQMEFEAMADGVIQVSAMRAAPAPQESVQGTPVVMKAGEEQLGDLKLYRVPLPVTVNAKGLKQVAFLNQDAVEGQLVYLTSCQRRDQQPYFSQKQWGWGSTIRSLEMENTKEDGLGVALPTGGITVFEPSSRGDLLLAEDWLRDYAEGQDVEIGMGKSQMVLAACGRAQAPPEGAAAQKWQSAGVRLTNVRSEPVQVRLELDSTADWQMRRNGRQLKDKDGKYILLLELPAGATREVRWQERQRK